MSLTQTIHDSLSTAIETIRPYRHKVTPNDYNFGILLTFLLPLALTTPHNTPAWRILRAGIFAPMLLAGWGYCAWVVYVENSSDQWGTTILMIFFTARTLELLVFWPAEENVYRIKPMFSPASAQSTNGTSSNLKSNIQQSECVFQLLPEPIPPPFTLAKLYWATSAFWSYRGIGWNFTPSLPNSSRRHPYLRDSTRAQFLKEKITNFILLWTIWDAHRTFRNLTPHASLYFGGGDTAPSYECLSTLQRAIYSLLVSGWIVLDIQKTHLLFSILCVGIGGVLGWEGEIWSPWGWPPLFGSVGEVWKYPGLATMWSRTWQHYFRRYLHIFGWVGLGENILGLTHSGASAHPRTMKQTRPKAFTASSSSTSASTPGASGRISPANPITADQLDSTVTQLEKDISASNQLSAGFRSTPTLTSKQEALESRTAIRPRLTFKLATSNFIKSLLVFTLSGIHHDGGNLAVRILHTPSNERVQLDGSLTLSRFFMLQPFALIFEAVIKTGYRRAKRAYLPYPTSGPSASVLKPRSGSGSGSAETMKSQETPEWLVFAERAIGFAWTWIWLGYSARFFVDGLTKEGMFSREDWHGKFPSLLGGILWGKWMH